MIKPTVGRVVWFFTPNRDGIPSLAHPGFQPLAAIVTHVWSDARVNLAVFNMNGVAVGLQAVHLLQDGETPGEDDIHWAEWMPFQKGQAAKTEAAEAKLGGKA